VKILVSIVKTNTLLKAVKGAMAVPPSGCDREMLLCIYLFILDTHTDK